MVVFTSSKCEEREEEEKMDEEITLQYEQLLRPKCRKVVEK